METNMISKIQKWSRRTNYFHSQRNGTSILKMTQLDTLGLSESTIKRKRNQLKETKLIKRRPGSSRKRPFTIKGVFYFKAFGC